MLEIHARGFWEKETICLFYKRVCFPNAGACKDVELSCIYKLHEDEKKRNYAKSQSERNRTRNLYSPCFHSYPRSITAGSELLAHKKGEQYHTTITWKNGKTCFSLLTTSLVSLRGSRTLIITTNGINNIDRDIEVEESSIFKFQRRCLAIQL